MIVHASSVAWQGRGVLILGASGSGKTTLALALMAYGATLIADDRTEVTACPEGLIATPPATIAGLIEARGIGILRAAYTTAPLALAVDLDTAETERLPPFRHTLMLGCQLPLVLGRGQDHLAVAILQYLKDGRQS
ncbi:HPr kinase/phosphorylase [Falsirhodobacter deserti]|uniref:HPr kinase/phosphorylase n=1 Tax=Falsirhodobacter deserti TaxID=1365611 RepID=UPI000FE34852|nr:HPr kinase/phosphatase C-terminal domain-containing protein [Falsirhodobacter deserti]